MAGFVLKRVLPALVAVSLSLCSLQALAQQDLVTVQVPSTANIQLSSPIAMPTTNALGRSGASPFSHHGPGGGGLARGIRYPGDLQYHGGAVLPTTVHHTVYYNPTSSCPPITCFGNPITFLSDLSNSRMIHVTDQYVGTTANNRYPVGTNYIATANLGTILTDADMALIADAVANFSGQFGLGHIYHIFLVTGQDLCFDNTYTVCYSPDNPATWYFCAYHNSTVDVGNNDTVLYTAEPFQNVNGCAVQPGTPNGELTDSTNNVLSHETFETITDPVNGSGWNNTNDNGLYGQEIGDECSFLGYSAGVIVGFGPNYVRLNGKPYAIQPEYSNSQHACSTSLSE